MATVASLIAVGLAAFLFCLITDPGLGDGVRRIHPGSLLLLLPAVSYGLAAVLALVLPERDRLAGASGISLFLLLPIIFMGFAMHPIAGLAIAAVLGLPLIGIWTLLYRLARPRLTS